jgi:hypothetical protein
MVQWATSWYEMDERSTLCVLLLEYHEEILDVAVKEPTANLEAT